MHITVDTTPNTTIHIWPILSIVKYYSLVNSHLENDGNANPTRYTPNAPPIPITGLISWRKVATKKLIALTMEIRMNLCLVDISAGIISSQIIDEQ